MLFAVAVVAVATGAVTEFHVRMAHICAAADDAAVGVGGALRFCCRAEGNGAGGLDNLWTGFALRLDSPGGWQYIENILAKEQKIVGDGNQGEQTEGESTGEGKHYHLINRQCQIDHRKDPGSYRDDEKQKKLRIGVQSGKAQKQAHIQIENIGRPVGEEHRVNIHQHDAGEIKKIESQCAPCVFHSLAQRKITEKADGGKQEASGIISEDIGEKTPYLTLQDQRSVKIENVIQGISSFEHTHQVYQRTA